MPLSPRDRKSLIILGSVVVVAVAAFFLFFKKGSEEASQVAPLPPLAQGAPPTAAPSPSTGENKAPKLVFSGRDPFCCDPNAEASPVSASSPTPAPSVSPAGSPSPGPSGGSSATFNGQTIVLVSIFTADGQEMAQVEVDGTLYTVGEGDSFASNFELVSIDGPCADFLYGDQPFTLCESANK